MLRLAIGVLGQFSQHVDQMGQLERRDMAACARARLAVRCIGVFPFRPSLKWKCIALDPSLHPRLAFCSGKLSPNVGCC